MSTDEELTELLSKFMRKLRNYLDSGGPEDVIDRIMAAATLAAAAGLVMWPSSRKRKGMLGVVFAAAQQMWERRRFWGIP